MVDLEEQALKRPLVFAFNFDHNLSAEWQSACKLHMYHMPFWTGNTDPVRLEAMYILCLALVDLQ